MARKKKQIRKKKQFCIHGHDTFVTGRYASNNRCIQCQKDSYNPTPNVGPRKIRKDKGIPKVQICSKGHDKNVVGRDKQGHCIECVKIWKEEYYQDHKEILLPKLKERNKKRRLKLKEIREIEQQKALEEALEKGVKICSKCEIEKPLNQFSPDEGRYLGVSTYCRDCQNGLSKDWKHKNREKHNAQGRKWHREHNKQSRANGKRWRANNKEHQALVGKIWRANNKARRSHNEAKRRMRGKITFGQKGIILFYKDKPKNSEIDHYIPLQGDFVSGLHVIWNLQYLTPKANRLKHNNIDLIEASEWYGRLLEQEGLK